MINAENSLLLYDILFVVYNVEPPLSYRNITPFYKPLSKHKFWFFKGLSTTVLSSVSVAAFMSCVCVFAPVTVTDNGIRRSTNR
jgi:hypothetical protein